MTTDADFFTDPEPMLATLARLFASEGAAKEVALLANSTATIKQTSYDNWNGGTYGYSLFLQIPHWLYNQIATEVENIEKSISEKASFLTRWYENEHLERVYLTNGASSKRKLGDAHLKGIGIGMEFMEQVQQDVKHGGDISQMGLNILGQSMTDAFEITDNRQHG